MSEESQKITSINGYLSLFSNKIRNLQSQGLSAYVECTKELHEKLMDLVADGKMDKFIAVNNNLYYLRGFQALCCLNDVEVGDMVCVLIEKVVGNWGWQEVGSNDPSGPFDNYPETIEHAMLILGKGNEIEVGKVKTADPGKYLCDSYPLNNISTIVDMMESCAFDGEFEWVDDDLFEYDKKKSEVIMNELRENLAIWARRHFSSKYWILGDLKKVKI